MREHVRPCASAKLHCAAGVAVVKASDLKEGDHVAELWWLDWSRRTEPITR